MLGIRRIDRYILRELLGPTILGFSIFTFILLMNAFFLVARQAVSKNLGWELTFRALALQLPELLILTIPMSVLLGVLIGIGRLSADSEWVALESAGRSPWALLKPAVILGLLMTLLALYVYWEVSPNARFGRRHVRSEIVLASNLAADLRPRRFYAPQEGLVLFVDEIRPGQLEGELERVLVYRRDRESSSEEIILAQSGSLRPTPDRSGRLELHLEDGVTHSYKNNAPMRYVRTAFVDWDQTIEAPQFLRAFQSAPEKGVLDMNAQELVDEIREARTEDDDILGPIRLRYALLEFQMRLALPAACILLAMLGVPLGVTRGRSGKGAGFAMALFVLLVYYLVFILFRDQAHRGDVAPWFGAWSGNIVIFVWFVIAYARMRKPKGAGLGPVARVRALAESALRLARRMSPARAEEEALAQDEDLARESRIRRHGGTRSRLFSRIDTYVGTYYVRMFTISILACYLLYFVVELRQLVGDAVKNDVPTSVVASYFKYFVPGMLPMTLPVACLIAATVTITLLIRSGELTAIKAGGVSVRRASFPILFLTLILCGVYFVVQDRIAPVTNQKREEVRDQIQNRTPRTYGTAGGRWVFGEDGEHLYHYRVYDAAEQTFRNLTVFTVDRDALRIREHIFSPMAQWNGTAWELKNSWYRSFLPDGSGDEYRADENGEIRTESFDPPDHFMQRLRALNRGEQLAQQLNVRELQAEIDNLRQSGYDTTRLEVSYYAKFSQPMAPLIMVLLGLPFAFLVGRRGSLYGIGVAIGLVIVYWATFAVFNALGLETILPPFLAAWAPNILYGLLGTYLLLFVRT